MLHYGAVAFLFRFGFPRKAQSFFNDIYFFLRILAIFLPIGLGAAVLGKIFSYYHNEIFAFGGFFLIVLGLILFLGKHFSLPFKINPILKNHSAGSVFTLGIFSGVATTCCAPVLAGVLALSALPASIFWGGIYTLSYVLGMVGPLFLISLFLDKINFTQKFAAVRKPFEYSLAGKKIKITINEAISGFVFMVMGVLIIFLAFTNRLFIHSEY